MLGAICKKSIGLIKLVKYTLPLHHIKLNLIAQCDHVQPRFCCIKQAKFIYSVDIMLSGRHCHLAITTTCLVQSECKQINVYWKCLNIIYLLLFHTLKIYKPINLCFPKTVLKLYHKVMDIYFGELCIICNCFLFSVIALSNCIPLTILFVK